MGYFPPRMTGNEFLGAQESNLPPRQKERFGLLWTDGVNWEHISFARRSSGFESLSAHLALPSQALYKNCGELVPSPGTLG